MLKLFGILMILIASWGYAGSLVTQLNHRRKHLGDCGEMLELLMGEIRYGKTPLQEAFLQTASRLGGILGEILKEIAEKLAENNYRSMEQVWNECFENRQKELGFTKEELEVVKNIGKNLGYLDIQTQMAHLTMYQKQMEGFLQQVEKTSKEKKKLYRSLSMVAGVMVILLLV